MARAPRLSRDAVVAAALEVLEAEGAGSLSMRRLARHLGVDPMAVYRHVRDKADLLGALCDATVSALTPLDPAGDWEPQVRRMAAELRDALVARPALVTVLMTAPSTPAAVALTHDAIALLVAAGLEEDEAATAFGTLFTCALGAIAFEAVPLPEPADAAALRTASAEALGGGAPPHLDAALRLMQQPDDVLRSIEVVLDGIRARLAG